MYSKKTKFLNFIKTKKSLTKKTGIRIIFIYFIYSIQRIKASKKCSKILCDLRNKLKSNFDNIFSKYKKYHFEFYGYLIQK